MAINYFVDPGNQFFHTKDVEVKIANELLNQKNVMIHANYNERSLAKLMLESLAKKPDVLVLGSSHIMPLTHSSLKTDSFYNAAVSSASLEDDIALYYVYQKRGWQPKTLIICLDPWLVNKFNGKEDWKINLIPDYNAGKKLIVGGNNHFSYYDQFYGYNVKYSQLLSVDYLKLSLVKLITELRSKKKKDANDFIVDSEACPACNIKQPDGARLPSKNDEATTPQQADLAVINEVDSGWQDYSQQQEVDPEYAYLFDHFISHLVANKVNVVFYFPPLEPMAYAQVVQKNPNYAMVPIAEKYFLSIASKYHLKTIASYDPAKAGLQSEDFFDSWHPKEKGILKIFGTYH